ncbi:MAG: Na/Pi cotransporter family protein [Symbiobacteriia bacterium]
MTWLHSVVGLAGGLGLFIFGMHLSSEGLQKMAAHRLKHLVKVLTSNRFLGLLVGLAVTVLLQGSNATAVLVVGFVSAQMMSLGQALGVLLGSAIGSSVTAQLIAFNIAEFALVLIFVGAGLQVFSRRSRHRSLGQTVLGFGLIFFGMSVMTGAMVPLRSYPAVGEALVRLEAYPALEFMVAVLGTVIIQSSPAFLAVLMGLATQGLIGPYAIVPFVLGTHLGGTVTGVLSSFSVPSRDAKRAAITNFAFKLVNGLVFLPFYRPLTDLVLLSTPSVSRQIANTHTFFSIAMAIGFLPVTNQVARLAMRLVPDRKGGLAEARYLDESLLEVPQVALSQAHQEALELGRVIREGMLAQLLPALRYGSDEVLDRIAATEQAVDIRYKQISKYITNVAGRNLSDELLEKGVQVLYTANDLEHIGDVAMSIAQMARKIQTEDLQLSPEGWDELESMFRQVRDNYDRALKAFAEDDEELAGRVLRAHPEMLRLEKDLRYSHFERMQSGNPKTMATSSIHLDLIEALLRIDSHAVNIAQAVLGIV